MSVTYGFFDSVNGDRKYNAAQMSDYFKGIVTEGVFQHLDGGLAVTAGTGMNVSVATGRAIVQNRWVNNDAAMAVSISSASDTYPRWDAIVIRLSTNNRTITITKKTGTAAASPVKPTMTRADGTYELCLAWVYVAAGASTVTVTDARSDTSVCGWAAVAQATSGEVDAQLNAMKTGFDGVTYASPAAMVQGCDTLLWNNDVSLLHFLHDRKLSAIDLSNYELIEGMTFPNGSTISTTTIFDIYDKLQTSSTAGGVSTPIILKDASGNLIHDISLQNYGITSGATQAVYYGKDGEYIGRYTTEDYDPSVIPANAYYLVIRVYENYNQKLSVIERNTANIPDWLISNKQPLNELTRSLRSTDGYSISDYYSGLFAMSNADFISELKAANTTGTWTDNVYSTISGGEITINADNSITVDNTEGSSNAVLWFPNITLTASEKVWLRNKSPIDVRLYKNSSSVISVINDIKSVIISTTASNYRLAIRAATGAISTIKELNLLTGVPIDDRIAEVETMEYHVGSGKDFETYTACIRALKDDARKKTIYIHSGVYDVFEETGGADYWLSITDEELNWRDVCDIIPPNTTIIGMGDVILKFEPTSAQITHVAADLASPVNVSGTCTIENITVNADNCRYGIHDETSGLDQYIGSVKKYKNVRINRVSTGAMGSHRDAFACGFDNEMTFEFENCNFYCDTVGTPLRFHDRGSARTRITVNNSIIRGGENIRSAVRLEDVSNNQNAHTFFTMASCYIGGKIHELTSSGGGRNPFDITLLNCSNVDIQIDTEVNPYTPAVYNI